MVIARTKGSIEPPHGSEWIINLLLRVVTFPHFGEILENDAASHQLVDFHVKIDLGSGDQSPAVEPERRKWADRIWSNRNESKFVELGPRIFEVPH